MEVINRIGEFNAMWPLLRVPSKNKLLHPLEQNVDHARHQSPQLKHSLYTAGGDVIRSGPANRNNC